MNRIENIKRYLEYIKKPRMKYLCNAMTVKEIKAAEKAISELYKGLKYNSYEFNVTMKEAFDCVVVTDNAFTVGDYILLKTSRDSMYIKNLFELRPLIPRLEILDLDKAIYSIISGVLYDKNIEYYVEDYTNIEANPMQKQQRFQELLMEYTTDRLQVYLRDQSHVEAMVISKNGSKRHLSVNSTVKLIDFR